MSRLLFTCLLALPLAGCFHITMDVNANVNVNVRLDQALTDFFGDFDQKTAASGAPAASNK